MGWLFPNCIVLLVSFLEASGAGYHQKQTQGLDKQISWSNDAIVLLPIIIYYQSA